MYPCGWSMLVNQGKAEGPLINVLATLPVNSSYLKVVSSRSNIRREGGAGCWLATIGHAGVWSIGDGSGVAGVARGQEGGVLRRWGVLHTHGVVPLPTPTNILQEKAVTERRVKSECVHSWQCPCAGKVLQNHSLLYRLMLSIINTELQAAGTYRVV